MKTKQLFTRHYAVRLAALVCVFAFAAGTVFADGVRKKIRFAKGKSSATVSGAVVRGDRDRYFLGARQGQTMTVSITSLEDNAVFQIYLDGEQETLDGAGEGDDATSWTGELPADSNYVIVVGGTRGNASYSLKVSIK
jgi:hypothetical protein